MVATMVAAFPAFAAAAPVGLPANPPTDVPTDAEVVAADAADAVEPDVAPAEAAGPPDARDLLARAEALAAGAPVPESLQQQVIPSDEPCLSVGSATWGRLINGVRLPELPSLRVRQRANYGTPETIAAIIYAVQKVQATHPDTPPLVVGDISRERGGRFRPHKSHQAGRDADIGYYIKGKAPTHLDHATPATLDVPRTWTFIEALLEDDKVEYIFVDRHLQRPLLAYAREVVKLPEARLRQLFSILHGRHARVGIIRHERGHADHLHVRFRSPIAVAAARDPANRDLVAQAPKGPELMTVRLSHKVKKGETLSHIARRYKVGVSDLMRWNSLKKTSILRPGQTVRILRERVVEPAPKGGRSAGT